MNDLTETVKNLRDRIQKLIWYANSIDRDEFDEIMTFHNGGRKPVSHWLDGQWERFRGNFLAWYADVDEGLQGAIIEGALKKYL